MNWHDLKTGELGTLIYVALATNGKRRAHKNNREFLSLSARGLLSIASAGKVYTTYQITDAGAALLLSVPDDYRQDFYPSVADVAQAKQNLTGRV